MRTQQKVATCKARREASREPNPADTSIMATQAPGLRENTFQLFRQPSLWCLGLGSPNKLYQTKTNSILKFQTTFSEGIFLKQQDTISCMSDWRRFLKDKLSSSEDVEKWTFLITTAGSLKWYNFLEGI